MKELATIYEQMRDTFAQEAGFVPSDGCDAMVRLYALSAQVQSLLAQADWVLDQSFPQTAQGEYLDYHAQTRGMTRSQATRATGMLCFSSPGTALTDCVIPEGTVAMTAEGVRFETTEEAVLSAGERTVSVPAQAAVPGASGNVIEGKIKLMSLMPVGIAQCVNEQPFTGGSDTESDESLRARILESYKRLPNGANAAFYEQEAMSVPTVAAAKAVGRARGIGTVDVYVATHSGTPDGALLDEIASVLDHKREIAVDVEVLAPAPVAVNVAAELSAAEGYDFSEVCDAVRAALGEHFTGERMGEDVHCAKLASLIYGVRGVENCHLLAPTEDITTGATRLPILGTVTLREIGADNT
ncbi:MAG: baseplate J/gp47 family protein [Eubacteriales bacterium]|nr:baseplate J/gp47 family protein [Eubacteriales bacterium]